MRCHKFMSIAASFLAAIACTEDPVVQEVDPPAPVDPVNPVGPVDPATGYTYFMYGLADIEINTDGSTAVNSKKIYRPCTIEVDGKGVFPDYSGHGKIRGRGNSTWEWYSKKPYRIKLDESSDFMGMKSNRDWVLLADYRDVTHMMNNVGFTMGHILDLQHANHSRYANVTLNGKDIGLYMITEQVEEGGHRVKLDKSTGILLTLDKDDGPDHSDDGDNFWSKVYKMAAAVKYPSDPSADSLNLVREAFAELEHAIQAMDWNGICALLDVDSMIKYLIVEEAICNVEMDNRPSLRSAFISRYSPDSKWIMGPIWDCDGGFSYDWGDMYDSWGYGHTYFNHVHTLIYGTDPYRHTGWYGSGIPDFFADLFGVPEFTARYKKIWNENRDAMLKGVLENIDNTEKIIGDAAGKDMKLWGINNYNHTGEVGKMKDWLTARFAYLDEVINAYPEK